MESPFQVTTQVDYILANWRSTVLNTVYVTSDTVLGGGIKITLTLKIL